MEFAAIGPIPFCGMLLADMGAEVIRIERPAASELGIPVQARFDHLNRGKRSLAVDVKHPEGRRVVHALLSSSDVVLEGFRPGTMERLGFGPDTVLAAKPALVYGRITGWGTAGPLANMAGHDLNFIAASGALAAMGEQGCAATGAAEPRLAILAVLQCIWPAASWRRWWPLGGMGSAKWWKPASPAGLSH